MRWRKLPRDLVMRMRRYYTYYYSRKTAFDENAILSDLTPSLRGEVVQHALKDTLVRVALFQDKRLEDPSFQADVFWMLKPVMASPKELIFSKGDISSDLFFLIKGQVEVISGVDGRVLYRVRSGQHFGETVVTGRRRTATHRAAQSCEMLAVSSSDLQQLFSSRPAEARVIISAVLAEHHRKERLRNLSLRLLIKKIEGQGEQGRREAAALRVQVAWTKMTDRVVTEAAHKLEEEQEQSREQLLSRNAITIGGGEPTTPSKDAAKKDGGSLDVMSSPDLPRLIERLGKVDELMTRLQGIVEAGNNTPHGKKPSGILSSRK
jgi:CRP-like cAMP-binding protein